MIIKKDLEQISINQISSWGIKRQVENELKIDLQIKNYKEPSEDQIRSIIGDFCRAKNITNEETLKKWKIDNGFNEVQFTSFVTRKWKWINWCLKKFEKQIPNYYLKRKHMLDKVKYSLIRVKNKNLADELYLRIKENEASFEEISLQYSEGPERNTLGHVGPVVIGKAHPKLSKLLQVGKVGQIWPPKKIESWWIIVRLISLENVPLDKRVFTELALELGLNYINRVKPKEINELIH